MLDDHPLIYELVDKFRDEHKKVVSNLLRLNSGKVSNRRNNNQIQEDQLRNVVLNYNKNKFDEFYESLSLILKY